MASIIGGTKCGAAKGVKLVSVNPIGCETVEGKGACSKSPASAPDAITVGASTRADARWTSSDWGTCVDSFAPGEQVGGMGMDGEHVVNNGTSEAAPLVTAAAALYLQSNPAATPAQVRSHLIGQATGDTLSGIGTGSPNKLLHIGNHGTPPACSGRDDTDIAIPDASGPAVTSSITISGSGGAASATSAVSVDIAHPYRGDLVIDLVAPDGSAYRLKDSNGDSGDDVVRTYTANLSGEQRDGAWKLRVRDVYQQDVGTIRGWALTL